MNLLEKLPFLKSDSNDTVEDLDAIEAKKERIEFHRSKVRNGPVKFSAPSNGQVRRAGQRLANRRTKKARRHQVRTFLLATQEAATLRGQLQAAGVVAYHSLAVDPIKQVHATVWIVKRFGVNDEEGKKSFLELDVRAAIQSALNRYESIIGQPTSQLDPAYVTPIYAEIVAA